MIEYYLNELIAEGITEIPRWLPPEKRAQIKPVTLPCTPRLDLDCITQSSTKDANCNLSGTAEPTTPDGEPC